jgi:hypothetical protein
MLENRRHAERTCQPDDQADWPDRVHSESGSAPVGFNTHQALIAYRNRTTVTIEACTNSTACPLRYPTPPGLATTETRVFGSEFFGNQTILSFFFDR